MIKNNIPIVIGAIKNGSIDNLIESNCINRQERRKILLEHFKENLRLLKLNSYQRNEIYSILKNRIANSSVHIKPILSLEQQKIYETLIKVIH